MLFYVPVKADQFVLHKLAVLRGGGLFFFAQQMVHRDVEIPGDLCQLIRRQALFSACCFTWYTLKGL